VKKTESVELKVLEDSSVKYNRARINVESDEDGFVEIKTRKSSKVETEEYRPKVNKQERQRQQRVKEVEAIVNK